MNLTKKIKRRNFVTEKFALLNFLKAIDGLTSGTGGESAEKPPSPAPPEQKNAGGDNGYGNYNYMQKMLERHEEISNRLKKK